MESNNYIAANREHPLLPVYKIRAELSKNGNIDSVFKMAIDDITKVLSKNFPFGKLKDGLEKNSSIGSNGDILDNVIIPERRLFSLRMRYANQAGDMAPRRWYYDLSIIEQDGVLNFGLQVRAEFFSRSPSRIMPPPELFQLLQALPLYQGRPLDGKPWIINAPEEIPALIEFVSSPQRTLPVILISEINRHRWTFTPHPPSFLINETYLAEHARGLAFVVRLAFPCSFAWMEAIGKRWNVYDGAVRVLWPGFDRENDLPQQHGFFGKEWIWHYRYEDMCGTRAFTAYLLSCLQSDNDRTRLNWQGLYWVPAARVLQAEIEMVRLADETNASEREKVLLRQLEALKDRNAELQENASVSLALAEEAESSLRYYKEQNRALRGRVEALTAHIKNSSKVPPEKSVPLPSTYAEMPEWVNQYLVGKLVLLPRAERMLPKAQFENARLVCQALRLLAEDYRDARLGNGSMTDFERKCREFGLYQSATRPTQVGREDDAYIVNYPIESRQRRVLKFHLCKGNSRDPRYCLRIYYFWDEESSQIVVGSLPGHLDIVTS